MRRLLFLTTLLAAMRATGVTMDWVTIGDPANACRSQSNGCYGSVGYVYRMSAHEVTNGQYAEFLNAVAPTDTHALYNPDMAVYGGIARTGTPGSYTYSAIAGRENMPVNWVSFNDALRFTNWLHNGQPSGLQDVTTTEGGAYTITQQGIADNSIVRNPGALVFLPSEDEWFKAAYYDVVSATYFEYAAGSDTQITCSVAPGGGNHANCGAVGSNDFTPVGSYPGSPSPNGTFDQAGNALEWHEATAFSTARGLRGGHFVASAEETAASYTRLAMDSSSEAFSVGFRVAAIVPEPSTGLLVSAGLVVLALRRRLPASGPEGVPRERHLPGTGASGR